MVWKALAAFFTLSFIGAGSYFVIKKRRVKPVEPSSPKVVRTSTVELKISKDTIGLVIGRAGNTLKEIEQRSETNIRIIDDPSSFDQKLCTIKGTPEGVQLAQCLIHEVIISQPLIETLEMQIPVNACGRIIGKNGDSIRMICRSSNAKLTLENALRSPLAFERRLIIKGTPDQIAMAKVLVEQKLEEETAYRNKLESQLSSRAPRNKAKYSLPGRGEREESEAFKNKTRLMSTATNGMMEVYVSAVESPDRLWVQLMGPATVDLDRLNESMTEYYSKKENQDKHILTEVKCGQIVAAPFAFDKKWYRAEVLEVSSEENGDEPNLLLYYVDYGDTFVCKRSQVFELRTEFLRLRFQAVECMLAKVKPRDDKWSEEAVDYLEDLTHAALWKPVMAKIYTYKERPTKVKREGSPIPCLELFDTNGDKTINVGEELIEKGYAERGEEEFFDNFPNGFFL